MQMKNIFVFFLIVSFFCLGALSYSQEQVPNGGLEIWTNNKPQNWNTSNDLTNLPFVGYLSVNRSNDAYEGEYAARIITGTLIGNVVPGFLTIGVLNVNIQNPEQSGITGGHPFNSRPLLLKGRYKYSTSGEDTGLGALLLSKFNAVTGKRDTIAAGGWFFSPQSEYVEFSMPILYLKNETPDTLNVLFVSSNFENTTNGSQLFVDDLEFVYGEVSFINLGEDTFLCAGQSITLDAGEGFQSYNWVSIDGLEPLGQGQQLVVTQPGHYGVIAFDAEGLPVTGTIWVFGAPGPEVFDVAGGGHFSNPDTGLEVTLSGSKLGTRYLLYRNETFVKEWTGTGVPISFGIQPEGKYSVKAINTDEHQCEIMMNGTVSVTNTTNVLEVDALETLLIFPNPGKGLFTVETGLGFIKGRLSVFSLNGKMVFTKTIETSSGGTFSFHLPKETIPGVYFMKLEFEGLRVKLGKFVVSQ
jgi:hypothetical protein